eukprot:1630450-Ditylum_brightwellii.AAC.1
MKATKHKALKQSHEAGDGACVTLRVCGCLIGSEIAILCTVDRCISRQGKLLDVPLKHGLLLAIGITANDDCIVIRIEDIGDEGGVLLVQQQSLFGAADFHAAVICV